MLINRGTLTFRPKCVNQQCNFYPKWIVTALLNPDSEGMPQVLYASMGACVDHVDWLMQTFASRIIANWHAIWMAAKVETDEFLLLYPAVVEVIPFHENIDTGIGAV